MPQTTHAHADPARARTRRQDPEADAPAAPVPLPARAGVVRREFVYAPDRKDYTKPKNQVKYGPGEGLSPEDQTLAHQKIYGAQTPVPTPGSKDMKKTVLFDRLSQYSPSHATYLQHAHHTERPLTLQEQTALDTGANTEGASINHVIASGVGQNTLNQGLANFARGEQGMPTAPASTSDTDVAAYQKGVRTSLAQQAAAVGRVQMYNRAIAFENLAPDQKKASLARGAKPLVSEMESDETETVDAPTDVSADDMVDDHQPDTSPDDVVMGGTAPPAPLLTPPTPVVAPPVGPATPAAAHDVERNALLKKTIGVMEGGGLEGYKGLLKSTFDSPANLRVGHGGVNGVVSTGLDVELDVDGNPTERSARLQEAHLAAAPDHDAKIWTTFKGSGDILSSSMAASGDAAPDPRARPGLKASTAISATGATKRRAADATKRQKAKRGRAVRKAREDESEE